MGRNPSNGLGRSSQTHGARWRRLRVSSSTSGGCCGVVLCSRLCFLASRMIPSRTLRVRGVPVYPKQDDVVRCSTRARLQQLHSCFKSSEQVGQGSTEYVIVFGLTAAMVGLIWRLISSLVVTDGLRPVISWWLSGLGVTW
jgi:hypothetical protein